MIGNSAAGDSGGAMALFGVSAVIQGPSRFIGNKASSAGAVALSGSGTAFTGSTTFTNNVVDRYGGALTITGDVEVTFDGATVISSNSGLWGGAISGDSGVKVTFDGSTTLSDNTAIDSAFGSAFLGDGGVLHLYQYSGAKFIFKGSTTITGNSASNLGGAFFIDFKALVSIEGKVCATNNTAAVSGGFAQLAGELRMADSADFNVDDNTPDTIFATDAGSHSIGGQVFCGSSSSSTPWRSATSYTITGPACADQCNAAFTDSVSTVTSCDTCTSGWSSSSCGCAPVSCIKPIITRPDADRAYFSRHLFVTYNCGPCLSTQCPATYALGGRGQCGNQQCQKHAPWVLVCRHLV